MLRRALLLVAAVMVFAPVAWAASNTPAPHNGSKALNILHTDVMKIAHDYAHKRYRAVCSDLTKREREHLGGTSRCIVEIALINAFAPIKKFTITSAKLSTNGTQGKVTVYLNGNKKHVVHAVVKWEGDRYRLDHQSGWHPKL